MSTSSRSAHTNLRGFLWALLLILVFVASHWLNFALWQHPDAKFVANDISYYRFWTQCLFGDMAGNPECEAALAGDGVMSEYPTPAVWILQFIYTLAAGPSAPYVPYVVLAVVCVALLVGTLLADRGRPRLGLGVAAVAILGALTWWFLDAMPFRAGPPGEYPGKLLENYYLAAMVLVEGIVAFLLFRQRRPWGSLFWIAFMALCGPIVWFRLDLITAALVALACLWVVQRPTTAGALIGIGAGIKLWPALLALPMAAPNPLRRTLGRKRTIGFLVAGVGLGVASLVVAGFRRSASPLVWQAERGLQMESVPATPITFLRAFTDMGAWEVKLSEYNAIEYFGPLVGPLLTLSTLLTALWLLLTVALTYRLVRHFRRDTTALTEAILLCVLAVILLSLVSNKTLSNQYVQWLAGPIAALLVLRQSAWLRRHLVVIVAAALAIAGLSQLTYPWLTMEIMGLPNAVGYGAMTMVLRNLLLVAMCIHVTALAWRASGAPDPLADEPERPEVFGKLPAEGIAA